APAEHGAPIEDFVPKAAAVNENQVVFGELAGLQQREHFPEFVHGAKAARKNNEGFGELREPELAHEKVMEVEAQLGADVGIRELLVGKLDGKADGLAAGFRSAAVGGFHDARAAAGADDEPPRMLAEGQGPGGAAGGGFAARSHYRGMR